MADDILARAIFKLDADEKGLFAKLDEAAQKVRGTTKDFKDQEKTVVDLIAKEQTLLEERKNAHNPGLLLKYNQAITETRSQIDTLKKSISASVDQTKNLEGAFTKVSASGFSAAKNIKSAFSSTAVNGARTEIQKVSENLDKIGAKDSFKGTKDSLKEVEHEAGGLSHTMEELGGKFLAAFTVEAIGEKVIEFGAESIKVFNEAQKAANDLKFAVKNIAGEGEGAFKELIEQSETLSKATGNLFSPKQIQIAHQRLLELNLTTEQSAKLMPRILDIAARANESVESVTEKIGQALEGNAKGLNKMGINFKSTGLVVNDVNSIIEASAGYIEGAKDALNDFANTGKITENKIEILYDKIGGHLAPVMNRIKLQFLETTEAALKFFESLGDENKSSIDSLADWALKYIGVNKNVITKSQLLKLQDADFEKLNDEEKKKRLIKLLADLAVATELGNKSEFLVLKEHLQSLNNLIDEADKKVEKEVVVKNENLKKLSTEALKKRLEASEAEYKKMTGLQISGESALTKIKSDIQKELDARQKGYEKSIENEKRYQATLEELKKQLKDSKDTGIQINIDTNLTGGDQINAKFDLEKRKNKEALDFQETKIRAEIKNEERLNEALDLLGKIRLQNDENIFANRVEALKKFYLAKAKFQNETEKQIAESEIEIDAMIYESDSEMYRRRKDILKNFWDVAISLAEQGGATELEILKMQEEEKLALAKINDQEVNRTKKLHQDLESEEHRHAQAVLDIEGATEKEKLANQLEFEKKKLEDMKSDSKVGELEYAKQLNTVDELQQKYDDVADEKRKKNIAQILDGIKTITDATFQSLQDIYSAEVNAVDQKISLQEQQITKAKAIADKGNAQLLNAEQKRLDDLNKQKAKYVRDQQALAIVELVVNTTLAISKAAAEGGALAPVTITATLIALAAGLIKARQLASQAAFFKGGEFSGEGYTGDGSIYGESNRFGNKPYIYHNKEFIFNNETTSRFRPIFHAIHEGKVNLNDWAEKVNAFESMQMNKMAYRDFLPYKVDSQTAFDETNHRLLNNIYKSIQEQERLKIVIDERGISAITSKYTARGETINRLAH